MPYIEGINMLKIKIMVGILLSLRINPPSQIICPIQIQLLSDKNEYIFAKKKNSL